MIQRDREWKMAGNRAAEIASSHLAHGPNGHDD